MNIDRRCGRIYDIGCLACRQMGWFGQCQVHHLNLDGKAGQVRRGDEFTIGLCPWHHDGLTPQGHTIATARRRFGPSLKHHSKAFRLKFGSDNALLAKQNELIAERESRLVGHVPLPEAKESL